MSRRAIIISQAEDYRGTLYDVRESRPTIHGFDLLIGWPVGHRGKGEGGPQVIATKPLVDLLLAHAHHPACPELPIGSTTAKRLRRLLGINRYTSIREWWEKHAETVATMTQEEFGRLHGRVAGAVSQQERRMGKRRIRKAGWWREPETVAIVMRGSVKEAAEALGLAEGSIRRMRWTLSRESSP